MKFSFIGHASFFLESRDTTILTDPWWNGPCFGAQWWIHPRPFVEVLENRKIDYIYVSHGHTDHLHPGTLTRFDRETKILVAKDLGIGLDLRKMGFSVLELPDGEEVELKDGLKAIVRPTMSGDSMLAISDGREVCVNLNDALHATPAWFQDQFIPWIRKKYPTIDYLFCGYGTASHFPNCYRIPGKDYPKTAARRQHHFNAVWARITQELKPKFAFPFAADVVLLEQDLFWANEPVHNAERPVDLLFRDGSPRDTEAIDLAPGFVIENGEIKKHILRQPLQSEGLSAGYKAQIEKANNYPEIPTSAISFILPLLENNLGVCDPYLRTFSGDYKVLLRFRNSQQGIVVEKSKRKISARLATSTNDSGIYDVIFTSRLSYLRRSLDSPYGNEIMFVGSGCLFDFPDREIISRRIHEEIRHIVQYHHAAPSPRYGGTNPLVHKSKQLVKRALGIQEDDLYDLEQWTEFSKT